MAFSDKGMTWSRRPIKSCLGAIRFIKRRLKAPYETITQLYKEYEFYKGSVRKNLPQYLTPSRWDIFSYGLSRYSIEILKVFFFWIFAQLVVASLWDIISGWLHSYSLFQFVAKPLLWFLLGTDVAIFCCLVVIIWANVAMYGPTSVSFVLALRCHPKYGRQQRLAERSYPRLSDSPERQMENWEFVRVLVTQIARQQAKQRLIYIVCALVIALSALSVISFLLTMKVASLALLQQSGCLLNAGGGIVRHLYFLLVTLGTIGYGDITFVDKPRGYMVGIATSSLVILSVMGFVSYINYYILGFKDRLLAGLDTVVGMESRGGSDPRNRKVEWIAKNLKEI